jgi:uncharacterized protein
MIIEIAKISPEGTRLEGEESTSVLLLEDERFIRPHGPILFEGRVEFVSQELIVQGCVSCTMELQCSRCAEFFSTTIADSSFLRAYDVPDEQESVDITPDLRETILLNLPSFPVCRPECAGICPQCGTDLNSNRCDCKPDVGDQRWGALDTLNLEK